MRHSTRRTTLCLLFVALLPASFANAGNLSAVINGKSKHINSSYDWNEANYGFGLEYGFASNSRWKTSFMVNCFRDSTNSMTYMTGGGLHRRLFESEKMAGLYLDLGLNAFLMTREDYNNNKPFPGLLPSVSVGNSIMGFNMTYLPKKAVQELLNADLVDPTIRGVFFVQFKISVDRLLP
jgi:hypothetical protein